MDNTTETERHLVPFDGSFRVSDTATAPPMERLSHAALRKALSAQVKALNRLQEKMYADGRYSVLLIFQATDAAGKDGTIRAILTGVNPAGCRVHAFGRPTDTELKHDFLWRTVRHLPERGKIGVFNRSYYEEVLTVRVHPALLEKQRLPDADGQAALWEKRFASIRDHERHLAANGVIILKFWLNVSAEEQRRRLLKRLRQPHKRWKFEPADVHERNHWNTRLAAYEAALNATSRSWAPWYAIPADDKPYMRCQVASTVVASIAALPLRYPPFSEEVESRLADYLKDLENPSR